MGQAIQSCPAPACERKGWVGEETDVLLTTFRLLEFSMSSANMTHLNVYFDDDHYLTIGWTNSVIETHCTVSDWFPICQLCWVLLSRCTTVAKIFGFFFSNVSCQIYREL